MNSGILKIFLVIFFVSISIYVVKNNKEINQKIECSKNKKIIKYIVLIFIIGVLGYVFYKEIFDIKESLDYTIGFYKNNKLFDEYDILIEKENNFYNNCIKQKYEEKYMNPYILKGFNHIRWRMEYWFYYRRSERKSICMGSSI